MTANFDFKKHFTKQKLTENIGLKITSLIVAIILWFVVVNFTDPTGTTKIDGIQVRIINQEIITGNSKTLEVVDGTDMISSVTIRAPRTVIKELGNSADNIIAVADMNTLMKDGISVPISISAAKYNDKIEIIRSSSDVLKVKIENKHTIQLPLTASTSGSIESGFILGNVVPAQNQIRISGPESVVNRIESAKVDVQVTGFTSDISTQADIMLFDTNGDGIPTSNLELNISSVKVDVEILATKKVPLLYSTIGVPKDGYGVTGEIECNPEMITIAGPSGIIDDITGIKVPAEVLNITGQSSDMLSIIDVKQYLPEGIRLADGDNSKASITVFIEQFAEENFGVFLKNVSIENVPLGFEASFDIDDVNIDFTLVGLRKDLEKLSLGNLNYRVDFDDYALLHDVTEFKEGKYKCFLVMDLPSAVMLKDNISVYVRLTKEED